MNDTMIRTDEFALRCQKILGVARQLYQSGPDWVTFFREVLGVEGAARQVIEAQSEYVQFERSPEFAEIQGMVNSLRNRKGAGGAALNEATRVITVRLPESLHEALKAEANDHNTSMNKLCIAKLLQVLADNEKAAPPTALTRPAAPAMAPRPVASVAQPAQSAATSGFRSTWNPSHGG